MDTKESLYRNLVICPDLQERYRLTNQELRVLLRLLDGISMTELSEELYIAKSTLREHASNLFLKLKISNRYELTRWVAREFVLETKTRSRNSI